ncbi:TrgA family protein [Roseobacter sp. GAI101]|uniref:TrgA family protein n=1 Tax=Roseobacter sp. (strain GAI101) TaxID=391589 RepID=UPI0003163473|nr:TrgA family protein [Roseobacter sp. GAI101]
MPTGSKFMAALCLSVLAFVLSYMIIPLMPETTQFGYFVPINMALGALAGWTVMGPRAGGGIAKGISNGLTGAFVLILWGVFTQAMLEMLKRALRRQYDGLGEAFIAVVSFAGEYLLIMATVPIAVTVVVGGVLSGLLTNCAKKRWP